MVGGPGYWRWSHRVPCSSRGRLDLLGLAVRGTGVSILSWPNCAGRSRDSLATRRGRDVTHTGPGRIHRDPRGCTDRPLEGHRTDDGGIPDGTQRRRVRPRRLPLELGGVRLLLDGAPAPLLFVSPGQINFAAPAGLTLSSPVRAELLAGGETVAEKDFYAVPPTPSLFQSVCAAGMAEAVRADGSPVDFAAPARSGEMVSVFVQGLGLNDALQRDGEVNRESNVSPPAHDRSGRGGGVCSEGRSGSASGSVESRPAPRRGL